MSIWMVRLAGDIGFRINDTEMGQVMADECCVASLMASGWHASSEVKVD